MSRKAGGACSKTAMASESGEGLRLILNVRLPLTHRFAATSPLAAGVKSDGTWVYTGTSFHTGWTARVAGAAGRG
jgi:hypothetical protein